MMKPNFSSGSSKFSVFLAYYLMWHTALMVNYPFRLRDFLELCYLGLLIYLFSFAFLFVMEGIMKRPLFGVRKTTYFPWRKSLQVSLPLVAALAVLSYFMGDAREMTTQRILTYIIGYVLGVGVFVAYIFGLRDKS